MNKITKWLLYGGIALILIGVFVFTPSGKNSPTEKTEAGRLASNAGTTQTQPAIDPAYDQTIRSGVVTNFPVGVWVTIYKNFVPGTSILTSFDTDAELVMFKVRLGGVVITNYASYHPETVRGTNSSAMAKVDVMSNSLEVQMLPGQKYNTFAAVWQRE